MAEDAETAAEEAAAEDTDAAAESVAEDAEAEAEEAAAEVTAAEAEEPLPEAPQAESIRTAEAVKRTVIKIAFADLFFIFHSLPDSFSFSCAVQCLRVFHVCASLCLYGLMSARAYVCTGLRLGGYYVCKDVSGSVYGNTDGLFIRRISAFPAAGIGKY